MTQVLYRTGMRTIQVVKNIEGLDGSQKAYGVCKYLGKGRCSVRRRAVHPRIVRVICSTEAHEGCATFRIGK